MARGKEKEEKKHIENEIFSGLLDGSERGVNECQKLDGRGRIGERR